MPDQSASQEAATRVLRELVTQWRDRAMTHRVRPPGAKATLSELNAAYLEASGVWRDAADELEAVLATPPASLTKPWFLKMRHQLTWRDRLRVVLRPTLTVRFDSPDGECHAACRLSVSIDDDAAGKDSSRV